MVIDSSALVAIVRGESEGARFQRLIEANTSRLVSAATLVEASMVMLSRFGEAGVTDLANFVGASNLEIVPFADEHVALALEGFRRFGKGTASRRAKLRRLLFLRFVQSDRTTPPLQGEDFSRTDVQAAS